MRSTAACTIACTAALVAFVLALVLPIHTRFGESCGSAYIAASPPPNDDSWFSTCAELRDARRGDFTLPALLAGLGLLASGTLTVRRYRDRVLGFEAPTL